MPTQVTNYQCPSCTGPLHYSGASGKLECDYCGSSYSVAEIEALYKEKEAKAEGTQKTGAGEETETSVETETSAETETEALTLNPRLMAPPDLWGASGHESWTPAS